MTDGARKTVGVMSPVGAEAAARQAGSRAARLPTGSVLRRGARDRSPWLSLSAVPSSSARSMGDPPAVSSGCGNRRLRDHGRPADVGEASAHDTRTRGKPHSPAAPIAGSATPVCGVPTWWRATPEIGERLMHLDDQSYELVGPDLVMPHVATDDVRDV
jgi:hypothetical protein